MYRILHGHVSPETAYIAEDYPYGRRLRCKARWWLETATKGAKKGQTRMMFQTTNPKFQNEYWNKPKGSTYAHFMVMYLDEHQHVQQDSLYHPWAEHLAVFKAKFYHQLNESERKSVDALEVTSRESNPVSWQEWDEKYPFKVEILEGFECMTAIAAKRKVEAVDPYEDKGYYKGQIFRCAIKDDGNTVTLDLDNGDGLCSADKKWVKISS